MIMTNARADGAALSGINLAVLLDLKLLAQSRKRKNHPDQNNDISGFLIMVIVLNHFLIFAIGMMSQTDNGMAVYHDPRPPTRPIPIHQRRSRPSRSPHELRPHVAGRRAPPETNRGRHRSRTTRKHECRPQGYRPRLHVSPSVC